MRMQLSRILVTTALNKRDLVDLQKATYDPLHAVPQCIGTGIYVMNNLPPPCPRRQRVYIHYW